MSSPSTPAGGCTTRRAHETHPGSLQLLRREWQRSQFGAAGRRHGAALVQVASPSKQPHASHLAEVRCVVGTIPSASDSHANLARIAMSHISGRAGWWKPPSPVLVRASGEQSSGATRQSELARTIPTQSVSPTDAVRLRMPGSVMRLRMLQASPASITRLLELQARKPSLIIHLYGRRRAQHEPSDGRRTPSSTRAGPSPSVSLSSDHARDRSRVERPPLSSSTVPQRLRHWHHGPVGVVGGDARKVTCGRIDQRDVASSPARWSEPRPRPHPFGRHSKSLPASRVAFPGGPFTLGRQDSCTNAFQKYGV